MAKVVFRSKARDDLRAIARYIATDNISRALSFTGELEAICVGLQKFPQRGTPEPELGNDIRRLTHASYNIYYRYWGGTVTILRVLHEARRAKGRL